jgi:thioredoxin-like negative regulator of GroEL
MSNTAVEHYMRGMTLFGEGEHIAAEDAFRQALAAQPKWTEAMHGLAMTLMHQGRLEDAITVGKEITEIDEEILLHTRASRSSTNASRRLLKRKATSRLPRT